MRARLPAVLAWACAAVLCASVAALSADVAIRGGTVWTVSGGAIENADVVISEGRIAGVGPNLAVPQGARVVDAAGRHVCPGFVDVHSHLGLTADELNETVVPVSLELPIQSAFWGDRQEVRRALGSGVTTLLLAPGERSPLVGPCSAVKLGRGSVLEPNAALKIVLGEAALLADRRPTSKPELLAMVREALSQADGAIAKAARDGLPVQIFCDGTSDAERALELMREFGLRASLAIGDVTNALPDLIAGTGASVIVLPLTGQPREKALEAPARLAAKGTKLAFASLAPATEEHDLRLSAALAAAAGLPQDAALRALTLDAAQAVNIADRVGSLEVGKDGDVLVIAGPPLNLASAVEYVIVDGDIIYERERG